MYYLKYIILAVVFTAVWSEVAVAQDATEIVRKMDQKMRGESLKAEIRMSIIRPSWKRSLSMKSWSLGQDYALILITEPARDEGTAFLKRGNEIWNWIPKVGRTIKIPPSMMMQSWMGSDFTNDDLVRESSVIQDYTHTLTGDSTILGREAYEIEMIPHEDAAVVWGKVLVWITKEEYLQLRAEFYDEDGELINIMTGTEIREFDGRSLPSKLEMIPVDKEGNKTVLEYQAMEFNADIPERFFSIQNMRRVE